MNTNKKVLVTGGSGFIAVHCIIKLLEQGYEVITTLRSLKRENEVKHMIHNGGIGSTDNLSFIEADLTNDKNWPQAVAGASYVIHVASPTPATRPDDGDAMVQMAVDGVLRVMKAAKDEGVKRVVLTSASGAVLAGHKKHPALFIEADWTNLASPIDAYQRSKTMAERAAWEYAKKENIELSAVNPVAVMGPVLGTDFSHSNHIILAMLNGKMPYLLKMGFDYVDVRDVADLHLLAMTRAEAAGERFLATANTNVTYKEVAKILKKHLGSAADNVSTKEIPDFMVRFLAHFKKELRMPATFLGQNTACSNAKAQKLLGWQPRSAEEAIIATAKSMIQLGLMKA